MQDPFSLEICYWVGLFFLVYTMVAPGEGKNNEYVQHALAALGLKSAFLNCEFRRGKPDLWTFGHHPAKLGLLV